MIHFYFFRERTTSAKGSSVFFFCLPIYRKGSNLRVGDSEYILFLNSSGGQLSCQNCVFDSVTLLGEKGTVCLAVCHFLRSGGN